MSSVTETLQWDNEEPFIPLRDGYRITPFRTSDTAAWWELRKDPDVLRNNNHDPSKPPPLESAERYVDQQLDAQPGLYDKMREGDLKGIDDCPMKIIRSPEGHLVGSTIIYPTDTPAWEIGFSLLPSARGKGLISLAVLQMMEFVEKILQVQEMQADVREDNTPCRKVLERAGWTVSHVLDDEEHSNLDVKILRYTVLLGS